MLASGLYCIFTAIAWFDDDIPSKISIRFFIATVFLLFISKSPVITYVIDESSARGIGFIIAIVVGVVALGAAWYRGHFDRNSRSSK